MTPLFATTAAIVALATAEPAQDVSYYPVDLKLETEALTERMDADLVSERAEELRRGLVQAFDESGIALASDPSSAQLRIELAWAGDKTLVYDVKIACARPDGSTHTLAFELLGDHFDVLQRIERDMPTILEWLERAESVDVAQPESVSTTPAERGGTPPDTNDHKRVGPMGWTGVGLMAAGVGPLLAGAVLLPQTDTELGLVQTDGGFESQPHTTRRHPLALTGTLVGVGGALVVTGVGLLVGDVVRRKNRRASTTLVPSIADHQFGVSIVGRF